MSSHLGREVNYNHSSAQSSAFDQTIALLITSRDTPTNCWRILWLHSLVMPLAAPLTCSKRIRSHNWAEDSPMKSLLPLLTVWVVVSFFGLDCGCCSASPSSYHGSILCWQLRGGKTKRIRLGCHGRLAQPAPTQTYACRISCHLSIATTLYSSSLFLEWVPFDNCYSRYSKRNQAIYLMLSWSFFLVIISSPNRLGCYSDIDSFLQRYLKES